LRPLFAPEGVFRAQCLKEYRRARVCSALICKKRRRHIRAPPAYAYKCEKGDETDAPSDASACPALFSRKDARRMRDILLLSEKTARGTVRHCKASPFNNKYISCPNVRQKCRIRTGFIEV